MVKGEAVYKTAERIKQYGIEAYIKQLNKTIKAHRTHKEWVRYYTKKYPGAVLAKPAARPDISRTQKSYWRDVKLLAKGRDIKPKESRSILKKLKTAGNVQVRVIKEGAGWQFILFGRFEHWDKEEVEKGKRNKKKEHEIKEQEGYSYVHYDENYEECYTEAFEEAENEAKSVLGGTGWMLIKVLKETWIRFIGVKK